MLRLGIIGGGNIVRTRHLPAIRSLAKHARVVGISDTHSERAAQVARIHSIPAAASNSGFTLQDISWLRDVDALVIATPPLSHGALINQALACGKHVLVEKPFVVDLDEGRRAIGLAKQRGLILAVNHNFQFSRGFAALQRDLSSRRLGALRSVYSVQLSNDKRRLPTWSEQLPLGLFYDESPHVFYLLRRFAGKHVALRSTYCLPSADPSKRTPRFLTLELEGDGLPASVHINFESPICEWLFAMIGDRGIGYVDLFRDIYCYLPHDGQHLMREVLTTSGLATVQHWRGFVNNGWSYMRHSLFYGFDTVYMNFLRAAASGDASYVAMHSALDGLAVNELQHAVVDKTLNQTRLSSAAGVPF